MLRAISFASMERGSSRAASSTYSRPVWSRPSAHSSLPAASQDSGSCGAMRSTSESAARASSPLPAATKASTDLRISISRAASAERPSWCSSRAWAGAPIAASALPRLFAASAWCHSRDARRSALDWAEGARDSGDRSGVVALLGAETSSFALQFQMSHVHDSDRDRAPYMPFLMPCMRYACNCLII